ncbi:MAG: HAMP domain-containing histidine kinase [Clostridiales bacterium]|nr:HAMP domain-containing histidine kinase [Clostridiales bacterium]
MKLFWKIFFTFTIFMAIVFSLFGTWCVYSAFDSTIEREIDQMNSENRMFKIVYEMTADSLNGVTIDEERLSSIAENMDTSLSRGEYYVCLYDDGGIMLYESSQTVGVHMSADELSEETRSYKITEDGENIMLIFASPIEINSSIYYIETTKDITYIYADRAATLSRIQLITLASVLLTALVTLIVSHFLTRSITELSKTARRFAKGNFEVRAKQKGNDEIAVLSKDFNFMADSIEQKIDELKDRAERQEEFTSSFAHELKTPLTSIIGYSDMIRTMPLSDEETMEYANYIYRQRKRLESLSYKLLELIASGKNDIELKEVPAEGLIRDVYNTVTPSLAERNISMSVSISKAVLIGDKDLLSSLLINLIDNARKASSEGSVIELKGRSDGNYYKISVKDHGIGIPKSELSHITEAFYMVDKSRARKEGGAGLGLSLCSRIVGIHNGSWEIQSREGIDTTITVRLPMKGGSKK